MKMLDLLLQHLPNNGGWPDGADYIADNGRGHVFKYCTKGQISGGSVPCLVRIDSTGLETVTREQYESALSAKNNEQDWDGKGLPPVGSIFEMRSKPKGIWRTTELIAAGQEQIIYKSEGMEFSGHKGNYEFRALRSPEDVARDEAIAAMCDIGYTLPAAIRFSKEEMSALYDALSGGKIPGFPFSK